MITPIWPEKTIIGTANDKIGKNLPIGETTENTLLRLAFHDCVPYLNGGKNDRSVQAKGYYFFSLAIMTYRRVILCLIKFW